MQAQQVLAYALRIVCKCIVTDRWSKNIRRTAHYFKLNARITAHVRQYPWRLWCSMVAESCSRHGSSTVSHQWYWVSSGFLLPVNGKEITLCSWHTVPNSKNTIYVPMEQLLITSVPNQSKQNAKVLRCSKPCHCFVVVTGQTGEICVYWPPSKSARTRKARPSMLRHARAPQYAAFVATDG